MKQMDLFEVLAMLKNGVTTDNLIAELSLEGQTVSDEDMIDYLITVALFLEDFKDTKYDSIIDQHVTTLHNRIVNAA